MQWPSSPHLSLALGTGAEAATAAVPASTRAISMRVRACSRRRPPACRALSRSGVDRRQSGVAVALCIGDVAGV